MSNNSPLSSRRKGMAVTSMILGLLGILGLISAFIIVPAFMFDSGRPTSIEKVAFTLGYIAGVLIIIGGIGSIVLGLLAFRKASKFPHTYGGKGFSILGIITSVLSIILYYFIAGGVAPNTLERMEQAKNETKAIDVIKSIATAQLTREATKGQFANLETLAAEGYIDPHLALGEFGGYLYSAEPVESRGVSMFDVTAKPKSGSDGSRSFGMNETMIIYEADGLIDIKGTLTDRIPKVGHTLVFSSDSNTSNTPLRSDQLLEVWQKEKYSVNRKLLLSYLTYKEMLESNTIFESMAAFARGNFSFENDANKVKGYIITPSFFGVTKTQVSLGRSFSSEDEEVKDTSAVILSNQFWESHFNKDPNIIGQEVTIRGTQHVVVGVMPPNLVGANDGDIYIPLRKTDRMDERMRYFRVIAKPKSGVSIEEVEADLNKIAQRLQEIHPETDSGLQVTVTVVDQ